MRLACRSAAAVLAVGLVLPGCDTGGAPAYGTDFYACTGSGLPRNEWERWSGPVAEVAVRTAGVTGTGRPSRERPCFNIGITDDSARPAVEAALRSRGVPTRAVTIGIMNVRFLPAPARSAT